MKNFNDKALHSLFEEQVERTPNSIAVLNTKGESLTYLELNQKANQLARKLLSSGLKKNQVVALNMKRSPELIIAILGTWKAGGVYLPIDTNLPVERKSYLIKDANPNFILTEVEFDQLNKYSTSNLEETASGYDLACLTYTSGSTGLPTGVLIEHRAISNGFLWRQKHFNHNGDDVFLVKSTISFVDSLIEIFSLIISGGKISISIEGDRNIKKVIDSIEQDKVSYIGFVPTMLAIFLDYICENNVFSKVRSLKAVFVSGEPLNLKLVQDFNELLNKANGTVLYNTYGLTEANDITFQNCSEDKDAPVVSIGKPIDNLRIYILDDNLNSVSLGEMGNLWVAGDALARGYLNNDSLNARKFKAVPGLGEARVLNTGDLARWMEDGKLLHLGRKDRQVKIRGNRVELGEIEYQLLKHKNIEKVVVVFTSYKLAAYYVAKGSLEIGQLRNYLLNVLPDYMVPNYFVAMKELPLTATGKIDVNALPKPNIIEEFNQGHEAKPLLPTNEIEKKLKSIWEELLGMKQIGIDEDFLDLGGHSLLVIMMSLRIQREFKVEISLFDIFKAMTIQNQAKLIAREIKRIGLPKEKNIALLNEKNQRGLFCFPPVGGYGLYFLPFAKEISTYSVYGFNFIEHEKRLQEYTSQIIKRQTDGPYFLMGYSAGGNLAFELAKDMERLGLKIGALILVDSVRKKSMINRSNTERNKVIEKLFKDVILKDYGNFIPNEEIKQVIEKKAQQNLVHIDQLVNGGAISADIHFIRAGSEESSNELYYLRGRTSSPNKVNSWDKSTKGSLYEYQGYGTHFDMMKGENVIQNARLIEEILSNAVGAKDCG